MFLPLHDQNNPPVTVTPFVSYFFLLIIIIVFSYQMLLKMGDNNEETVFIYRHGLIPFHLLCDSKNSQIIMDAPKQLKHIFPAYVKTSQLYTLFSPISYNFIHAGLFHLFINLWFFWIFADNIEEKLGHTAFFILYISSGLIGGLIHATFNVSSGVPLIGASACISGIMGAYILFFPGNLITTYFCPIWFFIRRIDFPAWVVLGFYLLANIISFAHIDRADANVAFDAHLGGFLWGLFLSYLLRQPINTPEKLSGNTGSSAI